MRSSSSEILSSAIAAAKETLQSLAQLEPQIAKAVDSIATCLTSGNKLLVCGNGGSAADAADFCTELACRFDRDRRPYPALNLSQGGSLLTATANDYGFEEIFARQVGAFGKPGDVLVAITTSGKSKNIQRALEQAKTSQLKTIALLGRDGGSSAGIADVDLVVRGDSTARIQVAHKFILHVVCEALEPHLAKK
jgi:D-sedoheptulose 7-phosphate isomerase